MKKKIQGALVSISPRRRAWMHPRLVHRALKKQRACILESPLYSFIVSLHGTCTRALTWSEYMYVCAYINIYEYVYMYMYVCMCCTDLV